jgi:molybdopterin-guanine dinucleotide biosynthesis protein A
MNGAIAILAGGESRRMGEDKALLRVGGKTMLELVARTALSARKRTIVVGRDVPEGWRIRNVAFIPDRRPGEGPLAGLATALAYAGGDILLLGCDMPLVTPEAIAWLEAAAERNPGSNAVVVRNGEGLEPLFSVYRQPLLPHVQGLLDRGFRSLHDLIEGTDPAIVDAPPSVAALLRNVNTMEDFRGLSSESADR